MELGSKQEELIVTLMIAADKVKLKHLVDNNLSLVYFAQTHPSFSKIMLWATILSPFINVDEINAENIMNFLQNKRPDIAQIVNLNWVKNQVEEIKKWKNGPG